MSWQRWLLALIIVLLGALQYGLVIYALRDLMRRPRVRGDNKITWALAIMIIPFAGALAYATFGPTSFLPRAPRAPRPVTRAPVSPRARRLPSWMTDLPDEDESSEGRRQ